MDTKSELPPSVSPPITISSLDVSIPQRLLDSSYREAQRNQSSAGATSTETKVIDELKREVGVTPSSSASLSVTNARYRELMDRYRRQNAAAADDLKDAPPPLSPFRMTNAVKTPSTFANLQLSLQNNNSTAAVFMFLPQRSINSNVQDAVDRYRKFANENANKANFYLLELDNMEFVINAVEPYGNVPTTTDISTINYPILSLLLAPSVDSTTLNQRVALGPYPVESSGEGFKTIESLLSIRKREEATTIPLPKINEIKSQQECRTKLWIYALTSNPDDVLQMSEDEGASSEDWPEIVQTRILGELATDEVIRAKTHHIGVAAWRPDKKRYYGMIFNLRKLVRFGADPSDAIVAENWFDDELKCNKLRARHFYAWLDVLRTNPGAGPPFGEPSPSPIEFKGPSGGGGGVGSDDSKIQPYIVPLPQQTSLLYSSINYLRGQPYATYLQLVGNKNEFILSPQQIQYLASYRNETPMKEGFLNNPAVQQMVVITFEQKIPGQTIIKLNLWRRNGSDGTLLRSGQIKPKGTMLPPVLTTEHLESVTHPSGSYNVPSIYYSIPPPSTYVPPPPPLPSTSSSSSSAGIPYSTIPIGDNSLFATYTEDSKPVDPTSWNYYYEMSPNIIQKLNTPEDRKEFDDKIRQEFIKNEKLKRLAVVQIQRSSPTDTTLTISQYERDNELQNKVVLKRKGRIPAKATLLPFTLTSRQLESATRVI